MVGCSWRKSRLLSIRNGGCNTSGGGAFTKMTAQLDILPGIVGTLEEVCRFGLSGQVNADLESLCR